jgi:hypothetical protein
MTSWLMERLSAEVARTCLRVLPEIDAPEVPVARYPPRDAPRWFARRGLARIARTGLL